MRTDKEIELAKAKTKYVGENYHEHNDAIRIAYEWFDAQRKTRSKIKRIYPIKHLIEKWAGRYVSSADVSVAAELHPHIQGVYPFFNISVSLTEPSTDRLAGVSEAMTQKSYREKHDSSVYKRREQNMLKRLKTITR